MDKQILHNVNKEKNKILLSDAICIEDKVWFMSDAFNGLFCMDIASGKIELIETFPNESYTKRFLYSSMERAGDKIYFSPYFAREIAVYDTKTHVFEKIELDEEMLQKKPGENLFYGIQRYNNFLFFIPAYCKTIVRLNMENNEIQYITEWAEIVGDNHEMNCTFFWAQKVLRKNKLFIPFYNMNAILELDCESLHCEIRFLNIDETGFSGICDDGKDMWLYTKKSGNLIRWNPENDKIIGVEVYNEGIKNGIDSLVRIISHNGRIELFETFASDRKRMGNASLAEVVEGSYSFVKENNDYIIYFEREKSLLTIINQAIDDVHMIEISTEGEIVDIDKMVERNEAFTEIEEYKLRNFLTGLTNYEKVKI